MEQKKFYLKRDHRGVRLVPVRGFEDYLVAEDGVVYSFKTKQLYKLKEVYIPQSKGVTVKFVQMYKNGKSLNRVVHRIVYESFHDVELGPKQKIHFKNGNTLDCSLKNLEIFKEPERKLEEGEEWIEGFENRYFLRNGEVWSFVADEYPKKLTPQKNNKQVKYTLIKDGKRYNYCKYPEKT